MADCNTLLQRKRQLLAKPEVDCGVFETPDATDGKLRIYVAPTVEPEVGIHERDIASSSLSKFEDVFGEVSNTHTFSSEIVGSGDRTIAPAEDVYFQACGYGRIDLHTMPIGAIVGGPFVRNEIVTGGTSSATGRVILEAADGESELVVETITGTFEVGGEALTGGNVWSYCNFNFNYFRRVFLQTYF